MNNLSLSTIFTIVFLLGLLMMTWFVIKFLIQIQRQRTVSGGIQVSSSYALGARQKLYVINFRDSDYLIGVTNENIQLLATLNESTPDLDTTNTVVE